MAITCAVIEDTGMGCLEPKEGNTILSGVGRAMGILNFQQRAGRTRTGTTLIARGRS